MRESVQVSAETCIAEPGGYRGSTFHVSAATTPGGDSWDLGHLAMTYTALAILHICAQPGDEGVPQEVQDEVAAVDVAGARRLVASLQNADGSFCAHRGGESDLRFLFCAAAVSRMCSMLEASASPGSQGWGGAAADFPLNGDAAVEYVLSCQTYEGGFGLCPGMEAHGGSTYCAVAALALLERLSALGAGAGSARWRLVRWLVWRQAGLQDGNQGRLARRVHRRGWRAWRRGWVVWGRWGGQLTP